MVAREKSRSARYHVCLNTDRRYDSWIASTPQWAADLLSVSALRRDAKNFEAVLGRVCEPVKRFCRGLSSPEAISGEHDVTVELAANQYSVTRATKDELFRKVDPARLDLATVGDTLLQPMDFMEYPFDYIFSPEGLAQCMVDVPPLVKGHTSLNLAPGVTRVQLVEKLRHMLYFSTDKEFLQAPANGLFALLKGLDENGDEHHRLVFDAVQGNAPFSMTKMQQLYERLVAADPERAKGLRCGDKVMNIASPSDTADMPPGAVCKSSGDFAHYYFQWAQLKFLLKYQGLFNIDGALVGMDAELVRVGLKVLGMGNLMAALIAHVAHWVLLTRALVRRPLRALRPGHTSVQHRADFATVVEISRGETDGCVPWTSVPLTMRTALMQLVPGGEGAGSSRLSKLRVPPAMLACEPLLRTPVGLEDGAWIEVVTSLVGGGRTARADVAATLRRNLPRGGLWLYFHALAEVYQDDNDTVMYSPRTCVCAAEINETVSVGGIHRLVTLLAADAKGLRQNFSKLRFPNRVTSPTLGVEVAFLPGPDARMRHAVSASKRCRVSATCDAVAAQGSKTSYVCEKLLASLGGDLTWIFLARRPLLSSLDLIYRAPRSPNRPEGLVRMERKLSNEIWVAGNLVPLAESTSAWFSDTLWAFDAAGSGSKGNGGYGVASRDGLSQEIATELTTVVGTGYGRLPLFRIQPNGAAPVERLADVDHAAPARRAAAFMEFNWKNRKSGWKAARQGQFKTPPRIVTVGEACAGSMAFDCAVRKPDAAGSILAMAGDNMTADSGFVKGRSSIRDLNRIYSLVAVRSLYYDTEARWLWIPSKANPADGPSRWWSERGRPHKPYYPGSEWRRDFARESGEAKRPGPVFARTHVVTRAHDLCVRRAMDLCGESASVVGAREDPYKGTLPGRGDLMRGRLFLASTKIDRGTLRVYVKALTGFSYFVRYHGSRSPSYEDAIASFVQMCFNTGAATRTTCTHLLCFMSYINVNSKTDCALAWKAWSGWGRFNPRVSWLPLPEPLALLFALELCQSEDPPDVQVGLATIVAHHVYARGSEVDGLCLQHVIRGDDARSFSGVPQLLFSTTKAGRPQSVSVDDRFVEAILEVAVSLARQREPTNSRARLFDFGPGGYLVRFARVQRSVGYLKALFVRHSNRHGGATGDFSTKLRTVLEISTRLRHSNVKTTQAYLQDAQAHLLLQELPLRVEELLAERGGVDGLRVMIAALLDVKWRM
jgi:hypothetical protein